MGWSIMPIKPRDKVPMTAHGLKDATTNIDTIRGWWAKDPQANIGLNCGKSGFVVVDLDKRAAHDGLVEWDTLLAERHLTVNTSTSLTGGGGRHLLFRAPEGVKIANSAGRLAPGIDVRGEGGYVVLPPSIHPSGKPYTWADGNTSIEILPEPVVQILTHEPDPWQIFTLRDAFAPREPLVWVVDGILPMGSLSIWYGAPGTLKSMILADLAMCVAAGSRWLAKPQSPTSSGFATTPGAVLWLDFDNGQRRTHERFAALAKGRRLGDATPIYYVSMPEPVLSAGDTESIRALAGRIVDRNISLVVIDNLGVIVGEADENSADMQRPMAGLRWLAETGPAVVVIHHQRKSSGTPTSTRSGDSLRGHGSIEAKLDLAMLVTREDETVTATATKSRGPAVKPFSATFNFENDDKHELQSAHFWPVDLAAEKAEEAAAEQKSLRDNIIETVGKQGPMSANDIFNAVGGNRNHVLDVLRQMNLERLIAKKQGPRNTFLISLP